MKKNSGFSLVELSITLGIIGLIIGGIVSGGHLMQAAKLNAVISEFSGYKEAIENFRLKYRAWPGDMPNATSYWGTANGNGDEQIGTSYTTEALRAWQQLALSGMIVGHYTGVDAGTPDFQIDVNVPGTEFSKTAYYFLYYTTSAGTHFGVYGTFLQLGSNQSNTSPWGSAMKPADAHLIDKKIDDGAPDTGDVYFFRGDEYSADTTKCVNPNKNAASGTAILTDDTVSCRMFLWLDKE